MKNKKENQEGMSSGIMLGFLIGILLILIGIAIGLGMGLQWVTKHTYIPIIVINILLMTSIAVNILITSAMMDRYFYRPKKKWYWKIIGYFYMVEDHMLGTIPGWILIGCGLLAITIGSTQYMLWHIGIWVTYIVVLILGRLIQVKKYKVIQHKIQKELHKEFKEWKALNASSPELADKLLTWYVREGKNFHLLNEDERNALVEKKVKELKGKI